MISLIFYVHSILTIIMSIIACKHVFTKYINHCKSLCLLGYVPSQLITPFWKSNVAL
jgi:hypothetical protein